LSGPLKALDDPEGVRVPSQLPPIIDAHVHLFPDRLFEAIWSWFDNYGWPIRYKLHTPQVLQFLFSRGIERVVGLLYAHKPGMARALNNFMIDVCSADSRVWGLATVFPGEEGAGAILDQAFRAGLKGVKLHCHVQCVGPDDPAMHEVYSACEEAQKTLVMHAGREPASPHYRCDAHRICSVELIEHVLRDHPRLRLCIPHLGADEFRDYERLIERYDNLWLDTTMALADYFPIPTPVRLLQARPERILYGTDFPDLPYAWDRELRKLLALGLPENDLTQILGQNAAALFDS